MIDLFLLAFDVTAVLAILLLWAYLAGSRD